MVSNLMTEEDLSSQVEPVYATLPDNSSSYKADYCKYHGLGHNILLPFEPYRDTWKHYDVVYPNYAMLQSHNLKSKQVVDTNTDRFDSFVHTVVHNIVHEKLHKVSHGMSHEKLHSQEYEELLAMD